MIIRNRVMSVRERLLCVLIVLAVMLSGCGKQPAAETEQPVATPVNSETPPTASPAVTVPPDPAEAIPQILRDVTGGSEEFPTDAQREEMAQKLGALGFSVLRDNENMLGYEPVAEFFKNTEADIDGEATVFFYPTSTITSRTFQYKDGKMTCAYTDYTAVGVENHDPEAITSFTYTEKGNFIYGMTAFPTDIPDYEGNLMGFRILPLSEKSREYYRKYVAVCTIFTKGPLTVTWSSGDFSKLNWEWIYDGLYRHETGKWMVDVSSPYYVPAPDIMHLSSVKLPADVVEGLLQKYFDVSSDTLRALDTYDKKTNTYQFTGFNGGGYTPALEVSKWQDNPDGSLTLWVDHVALEFGQELSAQSILTVMPAADGSFKYLSNVCTADVPADPAALSAYKAVLQNKAEFVSTYDGKHMDIKGLINSFYDTGTFSVAILRFAVVDLDNDGTPEVILWEQRNGDDYYGSEVLRYHSGVVYGYEFWYRGFNQLKADGTFCFSSSASDSGFGTAQFTENAYSIDKITYSQSYDSNGTTTYDSNGNPTISYFVNHESATRDEFESAFKKQGEKPDATWYDFTDDNKETVFTDS